MPVKDYSIVIFTSSGGFGTLTSADQPAALLPLANLPLISYSLEWVAVAGFSEALLIAPGEHAAAAISRWAQESYKGPVRINVVAVPEEKGTAGALRAVSSLLRTHLVLINSELLCDVPLAALLARYRAARSIATVLLAARRASLAPELKPGKPVKGVDYIGLDVSRQQLCFHASAQDVKEVLRLPRLILRHAGQVTLSTMLLDTETCVLHRCALDILEAKPTATSIKRDLIPYLVRQQFSRRPYASSAPAGGAPDGGSAGGPGGGPAASDPADPGADGGRTRRLTDAEMDLSGQPPAALMLDSRAMPPALGTGAPGPAAGVSRTVAVCFAKPNAYVTTVSDIRSYLEANRELAASGEAAHYYSALSGLTANPKHENFVHRTAELGARSVVGSACIVGEETRLADKCSVKKSVVGRRCRLGAGCKVMNSVIHDDVVIEEGCQVQGSVVGHGAVLLAGASLRECEVASGVVISAGVEHRNEAIGRPPSPRKSAQGVGAAGGS